MRLLLFFSALVFVIACSTNPNVPNDDISQLKKSSEVEPGITMGLNKKGEAVTNQKIKLAEYLKSLHEEIAQFETDIYGSESLGRNGLYGALRMCLDKSGELKRLPQKAILTRSEKNVGDKMFMTNNHEIVSVSEEYLMDRIKRYEGYKTSYEKQKEDFEERIRICNHTN